MPDIFSEQSEILVPPHVAALAPYETGLRPEEVQQRFGLKRVVKLASNENPLGTSPMALERAAQALPAMSRYPSGGLLLRERLAERFGTKLENVIVGAGSEGIMASIVRTFLCDDDEALSTEAAFQGFQILARGRGIPYRTVPYREWRYDLTALADAITPKTKLIYLANPNNPTGSFFKRKDFEAFHRRVPARVLIILDEAYFEFAITEPTYPDSMHYRFDNVITLRTFSKAYGLASVRVGYGFGHEALVSTLLKVKLPFEPGGPAEAAALGAIDDLDFMLRTVANNARGLAFLSSRLAALGVEFVPSAANFLMLIFRSSAAAQSMFDGLIQRGVIVRLLKVFGLPQCLRVSVGLPEENEFFIESLEQVQAALEVNEYAAID